MPRQIWTNRFPFGLSKTLEFLWIIHAVQIGRAGCKVCWNRPHIKHTWWYSELHHFNRKIHFCHRTVLLNAHRTRFKNSVIATRSKLQKAIAWRQTRAVYRKTDQERKRTEEWWCFRHLWALLPWWCLQQYFLDKNSLWASKKTQPS